MKKLEPLTDNKSQEIVLLFLQKLELLSPEERKEILMVIKYLNHPMFSSSIL